MLIQLLAEEPWGTESKKTNGIPNIDRSKLRSMAALEMLEAKAGGWGVSVVKAHAMQNKW